MEYEAVIGLEVHAELSTNSKIFCSCKNEFSVLANTNCCPICMGMPGVMPVLNKKVVDLAIKTGIALNCKINEVSHFDRKNYIYPDLPKSYQITQFDIPICEDGYIDIFIDKTTVKRVEIERIHIEEDAGKLIHNEDMTTSIDFNRCGVPLVEIVTKPDLRNAEEAKAFLNAVKSLLLYLEVSDCKMEQGAIRCDVNVSIMKKDSNKLGTRCEMKNINSFSAVSRSIEHEIKRQLDILRSNGIIQRETRRWDDVKHTSFTLRTKENAKDYRFFYEPDLQELVVNKNYIDMLAPEIPELAFDKVRRYKDIYFLSHSDAIYISENPELSKYFEAAVSLEKSSAKNIANWILTDVLNETNGKSISDFNIKPHRLISLIQLVEQGKLSNSAAKSVFKFMLNSNLSAVEIVNEKNLWQISDYDILLDIVHQVIKENPQSISAYQNGKTNALEFLFGQCMKKTKGRGNPNIIRNLINESVKIII